MALKCPGCKAEMVEVDDGDVRVDRCDSCGGMWLDTGELAKKGGALPPPGIEYRGERRCPRCDRPMMVRPSKVVELDVCPKCCGIYFDANEIDLLVDVSRTGPAPSAAAPPQAAASPAVGAQFVCDLCRRRLPLAEQVIGAQQTVCRQCAKRSHIKNDPQGRRKMERAQTQQRAAVPRQSAPPQWSPGKMPDGLFGLLMSVLDDTKK